MNRLKLKAGQAYRLLGNFEIHDERTGTLKGYALKGTILRIKRVAPEQDRAWAEGYAHPFPLSALEQKVMETD